MSISNIGFIGAGKVGFSLGKLFAESGVPVTGYYSRRRVSSKEAALFTGTKQYLSIEELIRDSDVIFLTVPDKEILPVYLSLRSFETADKSICHCSGALTVSDAFPDIESHAAQGFAIHPLYPFSDKFTAYKGLTDAFFCIEDRPGAKQWEEFFAGLNIRTKIIAPESKARYHAGCSIVSNAVCALSETGTQLLKDCGFTETEALDALAPLMESNLKNILQSGAKASLTGPVERCDTLTVKKQLGAISDSLDKKLYRLCCLKMITIAKIKNPDRDYSALVSYLEKEEEL